MRLIKISVVVLFVLVLTAASAFSQTFARRWGYSLRAGPAILSQDLGDSGIAENGVVLGGQLFYGWSNSYSFGLNLEWQNHDVTFNGLGVGDATTWSLIPYVEARTFLTRSLAPYISLGMGLNINTFNEAGACDTDCNVDADPTFALKLAGGTEILITNNLSLNTEVAWKLNDGHLDGEMLGTSLDDFNGSAFSILFGLRYRF